MPEQGSRPKYRLRVTRRLPALVEARLADRFDARLNADDTPLGPETLIAESEGCDGLLVTPADKITASLINALPASIRIIATFSVGFDHIDIPAAKARGITVTNTPDVLTDATADIALLLMLGAARGASWGERMVREATWSSWSPTKPLGLDVSGKRLGILGMGRIGQATARRARAFGMKIHYFSRKPVAAEDALGAVYHPSPEALAPHSDFLSIHCASTPETRGLVNARLLALLPKPAVLVNTARGDIVDDDALIGALTSGELAAAGLDVYRNEPNIDPRYRTLPNAFLLPHLGSATADTRTAMGMRAADNLEAFFEGKEPGDRL
jgi:lactate dehydrogenase-like 2-hydroxyacid dehydrogenase